MFNDQMALAVLCPPADMMRIVSALEQELETTFDGDRRWIVEQELIFWIDAANNRAALSRRSKSSDHKLN